MCVFVCAKRCLLFTILVGVVCIVWRCMGYIIACPGSIYKGGNSCYFTAFLFWRVLWVMVPIL